jgi:hypothetical protein
MGQKGHPSISVKMGDELGLNGYEVLRGNRLKSFKLTVKEQFDTDIGVGIKTQQHQIYQSA